MKLLVFNLVEVFLEIVVINYDSYIVENIDKL